MTVWVMRNLWYKHLHHTILMVLSVSQLHFLCHDDQIRVKNYLLGHFTQFLLTSCDEDSTIYGTNTIIRLEQSK